MLRTAGNKITWLGHSTFLLTTPTGNTLLIDPWLAGNPACPPSLHKLPRVDVIGVTHGHGDHIGDLLTTASEHQCDVACIFEIYLWLETKGIKKVHPMGKGGTQKIGEFEMTMVDARHSNSIMDEGKLIYGGEAAGFVVRLPGGFTIYHAGDTALFGDMKLIAEIYKPDLAMLPIGDLFTMGPREAATATRFLGVKHVIPMHYNTFPMLTGTPQALRDSAKDIAGLEIHEMKPGETLG
jgi:L-ascorbate metabolism protein UlaG (beta-lactamase superfamily)